MVLVMLKDLVAVVVPVLRRLVMMVVRDNFSHFAGPDVQSGIPSPNRTAFNSAVGPTGLYAGGGGGGQGNNHSPTSGGPGGGGAGKSGHPNAGDPGVYATGGGGGGGGTIPPTISRRIWRSRCCHHKIRSLNN